MIWTVLSVILCAGLLVKLILFSDEQRKHANSTYRMALFISAIYAFNHIVSVAYGPESTNPGLVVFHLLLLIAAFVIKPEQVMRHVNKGRRHDDHQVRH